MFERALSYGMYVNKGRALPDVRDGLKPVQRRILYSMDEIGARAGRPYVKSATVIGQVIGHYHPHGDTAVYDAMVRLAQDFSLNVPLVDGQGNYGSVGPKEYSDPPAAYRYTEARLTPAATDWLRDMRPEIVEFRPNFSERKQEPFVLPVSFPNLLVNGSKGIGWSLACDIPTHNLAEACEAAIVLAENPDATLDDLLAVMPGPDFPTGGIVVDPEELPDAYARGQGTFRLQGKYHIEQLPGNLQAIVVTELPYGVSPDQIVSEVVRAARAEKITDVTEMPKNLSDRNGLRVQIRCKRGGNVTKLIADLMRHTSLRVTIGINLTVVADGVPRQLDLREIVDRFVSFRFEVVTKRLEHERNELLRELHRLVALLAALDAIDAVIRIVRNAEDDDDAREKLKSELRVELHGSSRSGADRRRAGAVHPRHADQAPVAAEPLQAAGGARGEGPPRRRDRPHPRRLRRAPRDRRRRAAHHRREARRAAAHAARRRDARRRRRAGRLHRAPGRRRDRRGAAHRRGAVRHPRRRLRRAAARRPRLRACRSTSAPATPSRPPSSPTPRAS